MKKTSRRDLLATAAGTAVAAAITDASPAAAQAGPRPIFPVPATTIPIVGETEVFQVRRIYCIGRNYAAHAIERGSDPNREPPFFFQKPTDAIQNVAIGAVADHPYPSLTKNYHHEVELVAALKSGGTNIPPEKALDHVYGYALGLDMTRRDLQNGRRRRRSPGRSARASTTRPCSARSIRSPRSAILQRARSRSPSTARCGRIPISTR